MYCFIHYICVWNDNKWTPVSYLSTWKLQISNSWTQKVEWWLSEAGGKVIYYLYRISILQDERLEMDDGWVFILYNLV